MSRSLRFAFLLLAALLIAPVLPASAQQTVSGGILRPGTVPPSALTANAGTPSTSTYYRGDGSWQSVTASYTLPVASSSVLGGVKIGANITEAADGTISVATPAGGTFTPGAATLPSTIGAYAASYAGTSMYVYASAYWGGAAAVYAEGGGEMRWQYSLDGGATYVGIDGTSATDFLTKGSQFWVPHPIASGSLFVRCLDVNAAGSVTGFVATSIAYAAPPSAAAYALPTASASTLGGVKIDGTSITIVGGVISAATQTATGAAGGDLAGTYPSPTLAPVGASGTYGDATHYPILTTDSKGRVTGVTTQAVSGGATYTGTAPIVVSGTTISANTATTGSLGVVQPDGTSITITGSGVISAAASGGGGISYVSGDPSSPATGQTWYNYNTHRLKVKEASTVYYANFAPQTGKPSSGTTIDTGQSISGGLVLAYLLAEGSGTSIADSSATADTGTLSSSSEWATDSTYTTSLTFNGSNWAYFPYKAALNIETYSIALAFKTTTTTASMFYYWGSYGNASAPNLITAQVGILSSGDVFTQFADLSSSVTVISPSAYNDGNWHKVIATRVKSGAVKLYVDSATAVASGTDTVGSTISSGIGDGRLGARPADQSGYPGTQSFPVAGNEAYTDVWNRVLTSMEITNLMADPFLMYR